MAYEFGDYRLDTQREELYRGDRAVPLNRKAVQVLRALIERQGELVTKEELLSAVWPRGATINNVSQHVFMLRQALDDNADTHRYVLTVPRVGYRFVAPVKRSETESPAIILARHFCDNAQSLWTMRTKSSIESAIALYRRALDQDPHCAEAFAGLGVCRVLAAQYMYVPQLPALQEAEADAQRALDLDPRNAWALVTLAIVASQLRYEWAQAELLLSEALKMDPASLWAHVVLIEMYAMSGQLAPAREALAHAYSFAADDEPFPRLPLLRSVLHYLAREFSVAISDLRALLFDHPTYALARLTLAKALLMQGDANAAHRELQTVLDAPYDPLRPGQPNVRERALALDALAKRIAGDAQGARASAEELDAAGASVSGACLALAAIATGDRSAAVRHIAAAIERRDPLTAFAAMEPLLDGLRQMPEWCDAIQTMNLPSSNVFN